ncbi:MAG: hypothetical protein ABI348_10370 [Nitrososphaera sp.]|jgi:hypothetical protein
MQSNRENITNSKISRIITGVAIVAVAIAAAMLLTANKMPVQGTDRIQTAINAAYGDYRVKQVLDASIKNTTDFRTLDAQDRVVIRTWHTMNVSGNWQDGYQITYREGKTTDVLIDRNNGSVVSVITTPSSENTVEKTFTDNQKHLLEVFFGNDNVKSSLSGRADRNDFYVGNVRDQGMGNKSLILLFSAHDDTLLLQGGVDQDTGSVTFVSP